MTAIVTAMLALPGCAEKKPSATAQIEKARQLFAQGDNATALTAINAALKTDARSKDAHFLAGEIQQSLGDLKTAFAEFTRADLLDPNEHTARLRAIDLLIEANLLDVATTRVNAALGDQPGSIDLLARRALLESRQDKIVKARVDASAVLAASPGDPVANAVLADLWLRDKRFDLAQANIAQGLAAHPADAPLLRLQAGSYLAQGSVDKSLAVYKGIVANLPRSVVDRTALAELKAGAGAIDEGERTLRDGVAAAPASQPMRLQLAGYLMRHRSAAAAEAELRAAIATAPTDNGYDLALADVLSLDGRPDDAIIVLRAAVARLSDGAAKVGTRVALARLMAARNDDDAARAELDGILKADPASDDALMLRAGLSLRLRETAAATTDLLAVTGRRPASVEPFLQLANAYYQAGKIDDAVDAFKRVADLNPADASMALRLAAFCQQAGRSQCTRQVVADFVARNPGSPQGWIAAIRLALAEKDWAGAQRGLDGLRRLPNAADVAASLTAELNEAQGRFGEAAAGYAGLIGGTGPRPFDSRAAEAFSRASLAANHGPAAADVLSGLAKSETPAVAAAAGRALALLYQRLGRTAEALAVARLLVDAMPADPASHLLVAALLGQSKQAGQAVQALNDGMAAGAPRAPLLAARAELESANGRVAAAIDTYQEILTADSRSLAAANNVVSLLADQKPLDRDRLIAARGALLKLPYGDSSAILDTIAWADYRLGDFASAKRFLLRAQADTTSSPQLRYHLGAVMIALGEKADGRAMIRTVLNQNFSGRPEAGALVTD